MSSQTWRGQVLRVPDVQGGELLRVWRHHATFTGSPLPMLTKPTTRGTGTTARLRGNLWPGGTRVMRDLR